MEKEWMRHRLPDKPPEGLIAWTKKNYHADLGEEFLVFRGERVPVMPGMEEIMEHNSLTPRHYEWAAECTCTACHDTFITQKVRGYDAIRFAVGEDSMPYMLDPGEPWGAGDYMDHLCIEEAFAGEKLICPMCFSEVELIHSRSIRGGRTKRCMVQTVQNVEGYTTVFYWMVYRVIYESGIDHYDAEPMDAYVLTERGGLVRYTHVQRNSFGSYWRLQQWRQTERCVDMHDAIYQDWGSINNKKRGAVLYDEKLPDLEGTTGEKTGLTEYIRGGGFGLIQYLKFWRQHRNIENLVKAGQASLVAGIFKKANSYCYSIGAEMDKHLDMKKKKPHEMLRISKEDFRRLRKRGIALKVDMLDMYQRYRAASGRFSLMDFVEIYPEVGYSSMDAAIRIMKETPGTDLDKLARYMAKQNMRLSDVQYLIDTRRMARQVFAPQPITQEELWPWNLAAAHERFVQIQEEQRQMQDAERRKAFDGKFAEVIEIYGALQWTDGDLCIILPKSANDLHNEGKVLRHCVGGYTDRHISGSDTIFFVRHYRRPERSYYTLDIRMNRGAPTEVQLHGYGNERHGKNKEYSHKIPKKVRDFVDRWKREILIPWYIQKSQSEIKEKTA